MCKASEDDRENENNDTGDEEKETQTKRQKKWDGHNDSTDANTSAENATSRKCTDKPDPLPACFIRLELHDVTILVVSYLNKFLKCLSDIRQVSVGAAILSYFRGNGHFSQSVELFVSLSDLHQVYP